MKYVTYRLEFPNGYHVSDFRLSQAQIKISSDILFSALVHEASRMGSQRLVEKFVALFREERMSFSDLLPYVGETYFLPKPICVTESEHEQLDYQKDLKKIDFIPLEDLDTYFNGVIDIKKIAEKLENMGAYSSQEKINHQASGDHHIFNVATYHFNEGNGLYFLLSYEDNCEDDLFFFDDLMSSLQFTGIGGKRTLGYGRFDMDYVETDAAFLQRLECHGAQMLLNTSMASQDELDNVLTSGATYQLVRRGGFVFPGPNLGNLNTSRKKDLYFFDSGSIFEQRFKGDIFTVSQAYQHPVYRYSKPLFLGVAP